MSGRSNALGELIAAERRRLSLTRAELAALIRKTDRKLGSSGKQIERWELRGQEPQPAAIRALAAVLGRPVEELTAMVRQAPSTAGRNGMKLLELPPTFPADADYVAAIHATISHFVGLEVQHGGDGVAPLALHHFQAVRRRLQGGGHPRHLERDLTAAAGELAEVAAWLLHDADRQDDARLLNIEALHLTRLAGDRSIELLTMSNMAFQSLFVQRPGEALALARVALADDRLTNRQRVIFGLREARALAQLGDGPAALLMAAMAASAFEDGATGEDPEWSWWVDVSEVNGHLAWAYLEAGEPERAAPILQRSVEACPPSHANNHFFRLARFLGATVEAGAWSDAETLIGRLLPLVAEVRSGRAVRLLRGSIGRIQRDGTPARLQEASSRLGDGLAAAGYE